MNRIFKSIWNSSLGTMVAASEASTGGGKATSPTRGSRRRLTRAPAQRLALEPRIVFDGAAPVAGAQFFADHDVLDAPAPSTGPAPQAIVFVDSAITDASNLIQSLGSGLEVVVLQDSSDGLSQIAQTLAGRTNVTAVHLISHGGPGFLRLGNGTLDRNTLGAGHETDLATIRAALSANADLLVYGCDVSATSAGLSFAHALAQATGADVASSTDSTGALSLGGNWRLESQTGAIESQSLQIGSYDALLRSPNTPLSTPNASSFGNTLAAAFTRNGSAVITSDGVGNQQIIRLTQDTGAQAGAAWSNYQVSLTNNFTIDFDVYLGTKDGSGADGIAFALQNSGPTVTGLAGAGLGVGGIANSVAIEFDTWNNSNVQFVANGYTDIANDHITIYRPASGAYAGSVLGSQVATDIGNVEDGRWYNCVVSWNAGSQTLSYTFGGPSGTVSDSTVIDPIAVFGDNSVYFGWGASTGGASNLQQVALNSITNFSPVVDLNGGSAGTGYSTSFTENSSAVAVVGTGAFTGDVDNANLQSATVKLTNAFAGDQLLVNASASASGTVGSLSYTLTSTANDITVTFTGDASKASYDAALAAVTYINTSDAPNTTARSIQVSVSDGVATSDPPVTTTISVNAANDEPSGADKTLTTLEDTAYTLMQADFGFSDIVDSNSLNAVKISALPASGSLAYNGVAITAAQVSAGYFVSAADIAAGKLVYTPAANANGNGLASFGFQVQDNGGTANGGSDLDPSANTITFNVTAVNDAPTGADKTLTSLEDTAYTLTRSDFGFADVNDAPADAFQSVIITTLPTSGSLTLNGVAVSAGQEITVGDVVNGRLVFMPSANTQGAGISSLTFQVRDDGGTSTTTDVLIETFGQGTGRASFQSAGLTGTTSYTYEPTGFVQDGRYALVSSITPDQGPWWATDGSGTNYRASIRDATGDANGRFMEINASVTPGTFYQQQVVLAAAGTFEVSVALGNLVAFPVKPNITIQILDGGGTAVASSTTGDLANFTTPSQLWQTFALSANLTAGNYTFRLVNNAPGGTGNDLALDDVKFRQLLANAGADTDQTPNTITFNVTAVNDAPVDGNETASTTEDTTVTANAASGLLANSSDIDGNLLTITSFTIAGITGTQSVGSPVLISGVGSLTINADGSYSFTPAANYNGSVPLVTYTVSDGNGGTDTSTLALSITAANDAPSGSDKTLTTLEDTAYTLTQANFGFADLNDAPANAFQAVIITTLPTSGTLTLNGVAVSAGQEISAGDVISGALVFMPAVNTNGAGISSLSFQVRDDGGTANGGVDLDQSPNTITFNVTAVNDAPSGTNQTVTTLEDTAFTLTQADFGLSDTVDGNSLSAVKISALPASGSLAYNGVAITAAQVSAGYFVSAADIAAGKLVYTPAANANGNGLASFGFQVQDDGGTANGGVDLDQSPNTITFNVTAVNDAPVDGNETASTTEDTTVTANAASGLLANSSDIDGNLLTITSFTIAGITGTQSVGSPVLISGVGSLTINADGSYSFTPAADYNGSVPVVTYTVSDGQGGTDSSTLALSITAVNDMPVNAAPLSAATPEDTPLAFTGSLALAVSDPDNATLSVTLSVNHGRLSLSQVSGLGFTQGNGSASSTLAFSGSLADLNAALASLVFTPDANYNGPAQLNFLSSDGLTAPVMRTVALTVTPVNDAPAAPADLNQTAEDTPLEASAAAGVLAGASDVDGDTLAVHQFQLVGDSTVHAAGTTANIPGIGLLSIRSDGSYRFVPFANFNGSVPTASFTVSDGQGGTATGTLSLSVLPVADAPAPQGDSFIVAEDGTVSIDVLANDVEVDGQALTIAAVNGVAIADGGPAVAVTHGSVALVGGRLVFSPNPDYNGPATFSYTVTDGTFTSTANVSGTVTAVNDAPVALGDALVLAEDGSDTVNVLTNDLDVDGDTLTVTTIDGQPAIVGQAVVLSSGAGVATLQADGSIRFVAAPNVNGTVSFSYVISDGSASATALVSASIRAVNDAPAAANDSFVVAEDGSVSIPVLANDSDAEGDALAVTQVNGVAISSGGPAVAVSHGSVRLQGTSLLFTPDADYNGPVSFTYTVSDGQQSSSASVQGTVVAVQDAPVAVPDSLLTNQDTAVTGNLLTGEGSSADRDNDGDLLTVSLVNGQAYMPGGVITLPSGAQLRLQPNGEFSYDPLSVFAHLGAGQSAQDVFTYTIADGQGGNSTARVTVTVTGLDDALAISSLNDHSQPGTDLSVTEAGLATGSAPGLGRSAQGSFVLSAGDGLASLDVAGTTLSAADLSRTALAPISIATTLGTLQITGFDASTGTVSYTYTLDRPAQHSAGDVRDAVVLSLTDGNGDVAQATLGVAVVDDAPLALADSDEVVNSTGNPSSVAVGNVITGQSSTGDPNATDGVADTLGADAQAAAPITGVAAGAGALSGSSVGQPLAGLYGSLVLNADGSYIYTPATDNPAVRQLGAQATLQDSFTYQVSDADGSTAQARLTFTIFGTPAFLGLSDGGPSGTDGNALESGLAQGSLPGAGHVLSGSFLVVAPKGVDFIALGGAVISAAQLAGLSAAPLQVATEHGQLTLSGFDATTGRVDYRFELQRSADQSAGPVHEQLSLTVRDNLGDTGSSTLKITIVDDGVRAMNDSATASEDSGAPVVGSVLGNDSLGSDQTAQPITAVSAGNTLSATAVGQVGQAIEGQFGTLMLKADGSYSYAANSSLLQVRALAQGQSVVDTFTYQLTDSDGSTAQATLSIAVQGANTAPDLLADRFSVAEDSSVVLNPLANDSDPESDPLRITGIDGQPAVVGTPVSLSNGSGQVTLRADGTLLFTPSANFAGPVSFSYTVSDGDMLRSAQVSGEVTPVNDLPAATTQQANTAEDTPLAGNLLAQVADIEGDSLRVSAFSVAGLAGTFAAGDTVVIGGVGQLTLAADGRYALVPAPDYNGQVPLVTAVVTDGVGNTNLSLQIRVTPVNDAPTAQDQQLTAAPDVRLLTVDLTGQDKDGSILQVVIQSLPDPSQGELFMADRVTPVQAQQVLSAADASSLVLVPSINGNTTVLVQFVVIDNQGLASQPVQLRVAIPMPSDNVAAAAPIQPTFRLAPSYLDATPVAESSLHVLVAVAESQADSSGLSAMRLMMSSQGDGGVAERVSATSRGPSGSGVLGWSDTLHVQHAVRQQDQGADHAVHVQHAVRVSQIAQVQQQANATADINGSAFVAGPGFAFERADAAPAPSQPEQGPAKTEALPVRATAEAEASTEATAAQQDAPSARPADLTPRQRAAESFSEQMRKAATKMRAPQVSSREMA